jgi:hypothetical protein
LQEILPSGTLQDRTFDSPVFLLPRDDKHSKHDRLWPRGLSIATNWARANLGVSRFGIASQTGDGFPHGFEIQIVGPAAARQVLIHMSLLSTHSRGRRAFLEISSISDGRDL